MWATIAMPEDNPEFVIDIAARTEVSASQGGESAAMGESAAWRRSAWKNEPAR